jgi:hypothetical protein
MLGNRQIDQRSAQAAAWHLMDGLSFEQLAQKVKVQHLNGSVEMYFQPNNVSLAARAVSAIAQHVEKETQSSPGDAPTVDEPVTASLTTAKPSP